MSQESVFLTTPAPIAPVYRIEDAAPDPIPDPPHWQPEPPPTDLIFDDGEPLETNRHRIAMNSLIDAIQEALRVGEASPKGNRSDFFVGGNMFIYYSLHQIKNQDFRGPDVFVVLNVDGTRERQGWVVWEEAGRYPNVIIELLSDSTKSQDLGPKKHLYEQTFHTTDYFVFDPFDGTSLQGWHLTNQRYDPIAPNDRGWLWCESLQLWLGVWNGQIRREPPVETCDWLRLYDAEGNLVPIPEELAQVAQQQAQEERLRADEAEQHAQAAQQQAQAAQQQAQIAQQQAQIAQQQAQEERLRAEEQQQRAQEAQQQAQEERLRAEEQQQRADRFAAQLRTLGIDPNTL